jgi:hypothetical protein
MNEIFGEHLAKVFIRNGKVLNVALLLPYRQRNINYPKVKKLASRWRLVPFEIERVRSK